MIEPIFVNSDIFEKQTLKSVVLISAKNAN